MSRARCLLVWWFVGLLDYFLPIRLIYLPSSKASRIKQDKKPQYSRVHYSLLPPYTYIPLSLTQKDNTNNHYTTETTHPIPSLSRSSIFYLRPPLSLSETNQLANKITPLSPIYLSLPD